MSRKNILGFALGMIVLFLMASVSYAVVSPCEVPPGEHRTQTMGGWGTNCSGNNPGCIRNTYFPLVFPAGLTIGSAFTIHFDSSAAVKNFERATPHGTAGVLTSSLTNPTASPAGIFAKQVTALALNIGFGDYGVPSDPPFTDIGGLYLRQGPFTGWTVDQIFALANTVLGGNTAALPAGTSVSDLNDAVDAINNGFVDGNGGDGKLCPIPPCPPMPPMLVTVGSHFCLQFCGRPIKVYWCCPLPGQPVFSWQPGCLYGSEGCNIQCNPFAGNLYWTAQFDSSSSECPAPGGWWSAEFTAEGIGCVCVTFDRQLAVELLDFTAAVSQTNAVLRWSTASESNNDHFEISRDGRIVQHVNGAGNSTTRTDYSWVDRSGLTSGQTYDYTLEAVDISGIRRNLGTRSVTVGGESAVAFECALEQNYPNPFNPTTTIAFSVAERSFVRLAVFDLMGREVALLANDERDAGSYTAVFDAALLPAGVYFYRLNAGSFTAVRKLMLLK